MKVAFGTVIYEAAYPYHECFINAINRQNTKGFDVLLLNDNLDEDKCETLTHQIERKVNLCRCKPCMTIPELKIELIKSAKERDYDLLILGDFDDSFSENRVSQYITNYDSQYSFYYNDLYYMDKTNRFFCMLPPEVDQIEPILECNFLGFSNTGLNINTVDYALLNCLCAKQTTAFDWMVFSLFVLQGHKGKLINDCITYYRVHEHNIAGEIQCGMEGIIKEIEIKAAHYAKLVDTDTRYLSLYTFYADLLIKPGKASLLLKKWAINNRYWWGRINRSNILNDEVNDDHQQ